MSTRARCSSDDAGGTTTSCGRRNSNIRQILELANTYTPEPNFYGTDRFTYVVSDGAGGTATGMVEMTVLPVNDAPEAVGAIPDVTLEEGGEPVIVELARYFADADGDALSYTAESSDPAATVVEVNGATLTLSAVAAGGATVAVTATDAAGLSATQAFYVTVADGLVREVLTDTLAALGRGHLSSVRQAFGRRLGGKGTSAETPRLTLAGRALGAVMWSGTASGATRAHAWPFARSAAYLQGTPHLQGTPLGLPETAADRKLRESGGPSGPSGFAGDWSQGLSGMDMLLAFGDDAAGAGEPPGGRRRWTLWGQGDRQAFRETPAAGGGYEGDLRTGYLGVDAQVRRRWLLGVAMARSAGTGMWRRGAAAGRLTTTLTRVHPYVRWTNGDTAIWATAGGGRGTAAHVRTVTGIQETSPLSLALGLLEGRRRVATVAHGLRIGVRGEASWARLATGAGEESVDALEAEVRRVRGGLELARPFHGPGDLMLTAFGAASARHDGGVGPTGAGLDVAGGLRLQDGRIQVEAEGQRLVLHSATGYEEHGVSLAASLGVGPHEPGLTLSVRPTWGADGRGTETLWQDRIERYHHGVGDDGAGVDARMGYGLRLPGRGMLKPFGAYLQREHRGRRLQFGALLGSVDRGSGRPDPPLQLEIAGERYDRPGGAADHRFSMLGILRLGGDKPALASAASADPTATAQSYDEVEMPPRLPETAAGAVVVGTTAGGPGDYSSSRGPVEQAAAETAHGAPATPTRSAGRSNRPPALAAAARGSSGADAACTGSQKNGRRPAGRTPGYGPDAGGSPDRDRRAGQRSGHWRTSDRGGDGAGARDDDDIAREGAVYPRARVSGAGCLHLHRRGRGRPEREGARDGGGHARASFDAARRSS